MRYMLDTNIVAYAINKRPESVLQRLMSHQPEELCISSITMAELEYGVCNSSRPGQNRLALMAFLSQLAVLPFDADAAPTAPVATNLPAETGDAEPIEATADSGKDDVTATEVPAPASKFNALPIVIGACAVVVIGAVVAVLVAKNKKK